MTNWLLQFAYAGCLETDTPQERLQKAIMVIVPASISFCCLFWSSSYFYFGKPVSAAIPGSYAVISTLGILLFFKTKDYTFFRGSQILLILCLPFLLQASLGGFRAGSAVQVWAMLAPVGALMFQGPRAANRWLIAYLALTVVSGLLEERLAALVTPLPEPVITFFFVSNLSVAFFLVYISVHYYVVENRRIVRLLNEQKQKLLEMDQLKSRFLANISHEFRTPLALTIGPLEDALDNVYGTPGDRLRTQLEVMLRNSRRLLRLINQLLDFSKIESGEMSLYLEQTDLGRFLEQLTQAFLPFAEREGIELSCAAGQPEIVAPVDREKLEKVINNLLSNALKFTPAGGRVRLTLDTAGERDRRVCIRIKDTGPGIGPEDRERIFDRFYQVDGTSTRAHEGTGIGLSLAKELVELHNGTIEVQSEPGFGSEFMVSLPLTAPASDQAVAAADAAPVHAHQGAATEMACLDPDTGTGTGTVSVPRPANDNGAGEIVLVVDDNADIRNYVTGCLMPGYHVIQAVNGREGLDLARARMPDIVVSDIMMPVMDGYQLCRELRADPELAHIPLIFLTAKASDDMVVEGLETGADDYLAKPFNARELRARIHNLITLRRQARELKMLNRELELKLQDQLEELIRSRRLSHYFSPGLLQRILSTGDTESLVTERRNITIFFCDLCDFTDMTDRLEVERAASLLNEYLTEMTHLIERHGATIIQIIGDAIMVFFGAPEVMDDTEQAVRAVALGIDMQRRIAALAASWCARGMDYDIRARIGIHQDYVTVGNFGSHNLMEYTAVGRGVNLAARLESSCTPGCIKVSHSVYVQTRDRFNYKTVQEERFKGFSRQVKVAELDPAAQRAETPPDSAAAEEH